LSATAQTVPEAATPSDNRRQKLRVFIITENDPLYVVLFFDVFFSEYPREEIEICGITIDRPFHEPMWDAIRRVRVLYNLWELIRGTAAGWYRPSPLCPARMYCSSQMEPPDHNRRVSMMEIR